MSVCRKKLLPTDEKNVIVSRVSLKNCNFAALLN